MGLRAEYRGWRQRRRLAITCRAAVELMTDYLEGELTGKERDRFEQHLRHCPPCVRILDQLRVTPEVVAALDPDELDPGTRADLIELYRASRGS
jgi:predicted anti-sigma-YlaC factor YlaD